MIEQNTMSVFEKMMRPFLDALYPELPWYALACFLAAVLLGVPGEEPKERGGGGAVILWRLRHIAIGLTAIAAIILAAFPAMTGFAGGHEGQIEAAEQMRRTGVIIAAIAIPIAIVTRVLWGRYGEGWLSEAKRKMWVKQKTDKLSDIRTDIARGEARDFLPREHYKPGHILTGLDIENAAPIYTDYETFFGTHKAVIGATRFGKGLTFQTWIDQAIRAGASPVYIDPKGDEFIPVIMREAAAAAGRKFVEIDLNDEGKGSYGPIQNGTIRERQERLSELLGMAETGTNADHYKVLARSFLDRVLETLDKDGEPTTLFKVNEAARSMGKNEETDKALISPLAKLQRLGSRRGLRTKKSTGFNVETTLRNDAIVYVKGSLENEDVNLATRILISEFLQTARRLKTERTSQLSLYIDEVSFLISETIVKGLAAAANARVDISLAFQNFGDLTSPQDRTLDGDSILQKVNANCQLKVIFGGTDAKTAETIAKMSGTVWKRAAHREQTEVTSLGSEIWEGKRTIQEQEEAFITENAVLSLSKRVGVMFQPNRLAALVSVAPIRTEGTEAIVAQSTMSFAAE